MIDKNEKTWAIVIPCTLLNSFSCSELSFTYGGTTSLNASSTLHFHKWATPALGVCAQQIHICNLESAMEAARVVFPQSKLFFPAHEPWVWFQFSWLCASSIIPDKCCLSEWFGACHVSAGPLWPTAGSIPGPVEYNPWHHTASVENANYFYSNSTDMEIYRDTCIYLWVRSVWYTVRK